MSEVQLVVATLVGTWIVFIPAFAFAVGRAHRTHKPEHERMGYIILACLWPVLVAGVLLTFPWDALVWVYEAGKGDPPSYEEG